MTYRACVLLYGVPMLKKRSSECCAGPQIQNESSLAGFLVITYGRIGVIPEARFVLHRLWSAETLPRRRGEISNQVWESVLAGFRS